MTGVNMRDPLSVDFSLVSFHQILFFPILLQIRRIPGSLCVLGLAKNASEAECMILGVLQAPLCLQ